LLASITARLHILTYLPSLDVRQKYHMMFDMELDVQMEGIFNIWEKFIKVSSNMSPFSVMFFGRDYFKCPDLRVIHKKFLLQLSGSESPFKWFLNRILANKSAVKPISLCSGKATNLRSAVASHNNGCTRDFLCVFLFFKPYFLDRTTTSREQLCCKFFPGYYQQHREKQ
jgi:hypothetical protein